MELEKLRDETETVWGIVKYDITYDTIYNSEKKADETFILLNGLLTNNNSDRNNNARGSLIINEIARKKKAVELPFNEDMLEGEYWDSFIEVTQHYEAKKPDAVTLEIKKNPNASYTLLWDTGSSNPCVGVGFKIGTQLIVTFWYPKK